MATDPDIQGVEAVEDFGGVVERWNAELKAYHKATETWRTRCRRIVRRYTLESSDDAGGTSTYNEFRADAGNFNILWSNVQTMMPEVFEQAPKPVVERRHRDPDPIGRLSAQVLQRALDAELERDAFAEVFDAVALDYILVARGVPWVRYDATFERYRSAAAGLRRNQDGLPGDQRARSGRVHLLGGLRAQALPVLDAESARRMGRAPSADDQRAGTGAIRRREIRLLPAQPLLRAHERRDERAVQGHPRPRRSVGNLGRGQARNHLALSRVHRRRARQKARPAQAARVLSLPAPSVRDALAMRAWSRPPTTSSTPSSPTSSTT